MKVLNKKYTLLEGGNVIKCEWEDHTIYFTRLTAATSMTRLFMECGGSDNEYICYANEVTVYNYDTVNHSADGILITFEYDPEDSNEACKTLDMIVDFPYGAFVSEWY